MLFRDMKLFRVAVVALTLQSALAANRGANAKQSRRKLPPADMDMSMEASTDPIPPGWTGPMETCSQQWDCMTYTIEKEAASACSGECQFRICLTLDTTYDSCGKGGSISHTCVADGAQYPTGCNPTIANTAYNVDSDGHPLSFLRTTGEQCQTVEAGGEALFVLKDGSGCAANHPGDGTASCDLRQVGEPSCSGTGNELRECFWRIQAPGCDGSNKSGGGGTGEGSSGGTGGETGGGETGGGETGGGSPSIEIQKTVLLAGQNVAPPGFCNPGKEVVQGMSGQDAMYCMEVTNTGDEPLSNIQVTDECLQQFSYDRSAVLPPGGSFRVPYVIEMTGEMSQTGCDATVVGTGSSGGIVTDSDPAGHRLTSSEVDCSMEVTNTVVNGVTMVNTAETCTYCVCE